ncbi:MAG: hypothetical protein HOP29_00470 [Phycisphaerales bacterium]|nr:hypothetical protein [Phycisphaerales bacterium]
MKSKPLIVLVASWCVVLNAWAQSTPTDRQQPQSTPQKAAPGKASPVARVKSAVPPVMALLRSPVERVAWDNAPFSMVLEWLEDRGASAGPVHVRPNWRALNAEGIDKDAEVTLEMSDTNVYEILIELLDGLSNGDPLHYVGEGDVLRITTRTDLRRHLVSRSYDVNQIIAQIRGQRLNPRFDIGQTVHIVTFFPVDGAGVGVTTQPIDVGTSMFSDDFFSVGNNGRNNPGRGNDDDDDDDEGAEEEIIQDLLENIYTTIEPDTWNLNGGPGTAGVFNGVLTVRNSIDVHAQLGAPFIVSP